MKRYLLSISMAAVFLLISACSSVTEGEVIKKEHKEATSYVAMMPMVVAGANGTTTTTMIPYMIHHPERWVVTVEGKDEDGEMDTKKFYLEQEEYKSYSKGDHFNSEEADATTKEPKEKKEITEKEYAEMKED